MKRGLVMLAAALALAWTPSDAQTLTKLKAGMVTGMGADRPADCTGARLLREERPRCDDRTALCPGVDALNALQAGESEIVQVGVPMIGAVLRGMDLVALGNYSGNATKAGSDATVAIIAREGSGMVKGDQGASAARRLRPPSARSIIFISLPPSRRPA